MTDSSANHEIRVSALTFDVEDGINIAMRDYFSIDMGPTERVLKNMSVILDILTRTETKATFFILGEVTEKFPGLIKTIDSLGHEIGIHGYRHDQVFRLKPSELADGLKNAKDLTENIIGHKVYGFRAPAFSINRKTSWALDVIAGCGFEYDSSIFPSNSSRYGWPGFSKDICRVRLPEEKSLIEVPLSVVTIGRRAFPACGGGYLRYYPYSLTRSAFRIIGRQRPVIVYMHPYELDNEKYPDYFHNALLQAGLKKRMKLSMYRFRKSTVSTKLEKLCNEFSFAPLHEILRNAQKDTVIKEVNLPEKLHL